VQREKATVVIDLFLEDLFLFHNLQANSNNRLEKAVIQSGIEQHKTFLLERFQVLDAESNPLKGHVVDVKSFEIPADGVQNDQRPQVSALSTLSSRKPSPSPTQRAKRETGVVRSARSSLHTGTTA
jgi:hypothetical protein